MNGKGGSFFTQFFNCSDQTVGQNVTNALTGDDLFYEPE